MRHKGSLLTASMLVVAVGTLAPAQAAPPASFSKTMTFVDKTPDPTGYLLGPQHCQGQLPAEKPVRVVVPASGVVDIAISGFTGEWSLLVLDPAGKVVGVADADAPKTESLAVKMKRAGAIDILPCNLFGTFEATLTYSYRYKKL